MYCNNCGTHLPDGTRFCTNCGADNVAATKPAQAQTQQAVEYSGTQPYYPPPTPYKAKEPVLALILSWFVLMGSGHMYAGKAGKGVGLMVGGLVCAGITYGGTYMLIYGYSNMAFGIVLMVIGGICAFVIALYAHIDAYRTANKYNQFMQINGRPPTSGDNW
ncbi:MAG: zinc-ribbon domain-containing protein [Candidatus Heimdallarchaeaceae archaeon]